MNWKQLREMMVFSELNGRAQANPGQEPTKLTRPKLFNREISRLGCQCEEAIA